MKTILIMCPHLLVCFKELGLQHEGTVVLAPGAGFGDLSHPATRLVLAMMSERVVRKKVLDVGCGSGILSVAAARMGAKAVYGIDIDDEAILHASHNAVLNDVSSTCRFGWRQNYCTIFCRGLLNQWRLFFVPV